MKRLECEFESEILAAVLQSRWPDRTDPGLHAHVSACAICSDVATIAGAIDDSRENTRATARVPDSGRVWWLAQMRARREAAATAARPITAAQVIAFACAMVLLGACFGATSTWFQSALARIQSLLPSTITFLAEHLALALAGAAVVFLVPAIYLTMLRD